MRIFFFLLILMLSGFFKSVFAQDDIVLDLDSIKNIKTTRYSTINEVGANINVSGMMIQKLPGTQKKNNTPNRQTRHAFQNGTRSID